MAHRFARFNRRLRVTCAAIVTWVSLAAASCRSTPSPPPPTATAAEVIARHADSLMAIPGVVGVAETLGPRGETVLQVMLATNDRRVKQRIPRWIEGYRVTFEVTGPIRPM